MERKKNLESIKNKAYTIRGIPVMIDSDAAELYGVELKILTQAVRNNIERFPDDFSWVLTTEEIYELYKKYPELNISSKSRRKIRVFTLEGIYMLATVIESDIASEVLVTIIDIYVDMKHIISDDLKKQIFEKSHINTSIQFDM